jgi:signal transduction histidine kinase
MKIRNRLTLLFTVIFGVITLTSSLTIYYFSATFREDQFISRLQNSAMTVAKLRLELKNVDTTLLRIFDRNTLALINEQTLVFDQNGNIVYNTRLAKKTAISPALLHRVRADKFLRFKIGEEDGIGIIYGEPPHEYVLITTAFDKYGLSKLYYLRIILLGVTLAAIILTALMGWFFSGQALRPISKIIDEVEHISDTNLSARINEGNGTDELAHLAMTFNRMLVRLEDAFRMQRSFVSYASHELRTPLTSITTQLEVALEKDRDLPYYKKMNTSVLEDIRQLSALTNGLLNLANASFDVAGLRFDDLRIDELLWQVRDELLTANPQYHVDIDYITEPDEESNLVLDGNEQLLKVAISNLMDNACKYSEDKRVEVRIKPDGEEIILEFNDNGIGIDEEERVNVLIPFYRGRNTNSIKGHGLGLSLTKRIIDIHRGMMKIRGNEPSGTSIQVILPIST